jgi:hypothetical protein
VSERAIVTASTSGTVAFVVAATAAAVSPSALGRPALVLDVALFAGGVVAFVAGYLRGVNRSRREVVSIGGLYFLTGGTAPPAVRRRLLGALTVQVAVGLGTAVARPYTDLAGGVLVPMYGLGLCGLWASRHGRFPQRGDGGRRGPV